MGLDPQLIAAAAADLERGGIVEKASGFLGAPIWLHIERVLPGEIDPALMPEVASKIGEAFGMVGRSGMVGDSLEWTHSSDRSHLQVTVVPRKGQTKVRVVGKFPRIAVSFFLPALIVFGMWSTIISLAFKVDPAISFSIGALGLMIGFLLSRFGYSAYVRKKERAAEKIMRELDGMIERAGPSKKALAEKKSEKRIDLPEQESQETADDGVVRNRARSRN